jgi:hypothetical protein
VLTRSLKASVPGSPPAARLNHDSGLESSVNLPFAPLISKQHSAASAWNTKIPTRIYYLFITTVSNTHAVQTEPNGNMIINGDKRKDLDGDYDELCHHGPGKSKEYK